MIAKTGSSGALRGWPKAISLRGRLRRAPKNYLMPVFSVEFHQPEAKLETQLQRLQGQQEEAQAADRALLQEILQLTSDRFALHPRSSSASWRCGA